MKNKSNEDDASFVKVIVENSDNYFNYRRQSPSGVKWAFTELPPGDYNGEQVSKLAYTKGLKCDGNNFWKIIRNPIYCGTMVVPPYEEQEIQFLKGQHEPIRSQALFYEVQDVLNGNKKKATVKLDMFLLRGSLECPECHSMLTGSASKGGMANTFIITIAQVNVNAALKQKRLMNTLKIIY